MILYVQTFNILPNKFDAYAAFAQSFMATVMAGGEVDGVDGYFPLTGSQQRAILYRFGDLAAWATWRAKADISEAFEQLRDYTTDREEMLWQTPPG